MNLLAPVAVFAYKRKNHIIKTLQALNESPLAKYSDIYVFCDNYKNEKDKLDVEEARGAVDSFFLNSKFKKTIVIKAENNKGLACSIIDGVSELMVNYGKVIVVEDDLLTSKFFLQYMNEALNYYEKINNVWAISGYSFPIKSLNNYPHDIFYSGRGCSWGWASWFDRWKIIDWEVRDYSKFKYNWRKRIGFSRWGQDLPTMLDSQMCLDVNSWAIRWCYEAFKRDMLVVYPKESHVQNMGIDGSGTHSKNCYSNKFDTNLYASENYKCNFEILDINNSIRKDFAKKYSNGIYLDLKQQAKSFLVRHNLWGLYYRLKLLRKTIIRLRNDT